jgi:hypothetical protein
VLSIFCSSALAAVDELFAGDGAIEEAFEIGEGADADVAADEGELAAAIGASFFEGFVDLFLAFGVEGLAVDEDEFAVVFAFEHDDVVGFKFGAFEGAVFRGFPLFAVFAVGEFPVGLGVAFGDGGCEEFGGRRGCGEPKQ